MNVHVIEVLGVAHTQNRTHHYIYMYIEQDNVLIRVVLYVVQ